MPSDNDQESIVCWLAAPAAYAHNPAGVAHIQTHISHVFLAGPYVYKLKKPVRYDFLDFSTVAARACLPRGAAAQPASGARGFFNGLLTVLDGERRDDGIWRTIES
jgi:hypothetical protein